jgi:RTX calcium-binding nonapeptide repeat (4 copies)
MRLARRHPSPGVVSLAVSVLLAATAPATVLAAPANDNFGAAQVLGSAASGSVSGSNVDATKETGEPDHAGNSGGHSVWYSWTAPADGHGFFTTDGSAFDTLLAVYTGVAVDSLTTVASNDDDPLLVFIGQSTVSFSVLSGVTYMLAVDGFSGKVGRIELRWGRAPANDNFADAQTLPGVPSGTATGNVRGATSEPGEPSGVFEVRTIWYSWTAPTDGTYKFDTLGSRFDTVLAVYRGSTLDSLARVGENDDDPDRGCCSSWVPIRNATAGTTYSISVGALDGFCRTCNVVLNWSPLILGGSGPDTLVGGAGAEEIRGRGGADILRGGGGHDSLLGGRGNDREDGGPGNDVVLDRAGVDRLFGRIGNDQLDSRDFGRGDLLSGGLGTDVCRGDRVDVRRGCP